MTGFRSYDSWKCTDEADERAAAREDMRDKLATKRGCDADDISDADLDDWLNELEAERQAAMEDYYEAKRESRLHPNDWDN